MDRIALIDGTQGRRLPIKPRFGEACNGCGLCCAAEPGGLALDLMRADPAAACPALEWEAGRFYCGLIRWASRYLDLPHDWADAHLGSVFSEALGAGRGCDADQL